MNGLPALKLWQAPDIGNILRNIAVIKGQKLRSRLAEIGETREERREVRDIARLNLQKGAAKRAKAEEEREIEDWEWEKALRNSEILLSSSQLVLRTAQRSPQDAQKAHDIAIKTLQEIKVETDKIPEEWGPEAQQFWQQTVQEARPFVAWLMAQEERKKGPVKTKRVWDKETEQYVQKSQVAINKDPDRYGMTKEQAVEMRKAGAPKVEVITGRAVAKKEALTKFEVEKGPDFVLNELQKYKDLHEGTWDIEVPEEREEEFRKSVLRSIKGLYPDAKFLIDETSGKIILWADKGKVQRPWAKWNFELKPKPRK